MCRRCSWTLVAFQICNVLILTPLTLPCYILRCMSAQMLELFFAKRRKPVLTLSIMNPRPHNVRRLLSRHRGLYVKVSKEFRALLTQQRQDNALVKMPRYKLSSAIWRTKLQSLHGFSESLNAIFWSDFPWARSFNGRSERKPAHAQHGSTSRAFSAIPVSIRVFSIYTLLMVILQAMIAGQG